MNLMTQLQLPLKIRGQKKGDNIVSRNLRFYKQKKRSWQKDLGIFLIFTSFVWGGLQIGMNYSAYAQIAKFKFDTLTASLFEAEPEVVETALSPIVGKKMAERNTFRNQALKPRNHAQSVFEDMPIYPSDNRLYIPRINKNVPLITVPNHNNWQQLENNIQEGLQDGIVVHPISHNPDSFGNFFLTGHSSYYQWDPGRFKDIFALLHEVKIGDTVEVYWEGKLYKYIIEESHVVEPDEVSVLNQPSDESILTMMTCTPVGTNKNRLIKVARPIN